MGVLNDNLTVMTDVESSQNGFVVIIDRVSGARNLIARADSSKHIIPEAVDGNVPEPGERWRVRKVRHRAHPIALEPLEHIETIENHSPQYENNNRSPIKKEGVKKRPLGEDPSKGPSEKKKGTAGAKVKSYTSSKNHLLTGSQ